MSKMSAKQKQKGVSKRDVLKGAVVRGAAGDLAGFRAKEARTAMHSSGEKIPSVKADVVVIGLGIAGLCASIRAAELGVKVIAIDKLKYFEDTSEIFQELPGGPGSATLKAGGCDWAEDIKTMRGKTDFESMLDIMPSGVTEFEEKAGVEATLSSTKKSCG